MVRERQRRRGRVDEGATFSSSGGGGCSVWSPSFKCPSRRHRAAVPRRCDRPSTVHGGVPCALTCTFTRQTHIPAYRPAHRCTARLVCRPLLETTVDLLGRRDETPEHHGDDSDGSGGAKTHRADVIRPVPPPAGVCSDCHARRFAGLISQRSRTCVVRLRTGAAQQAPRWRQGVRAFGPEHRLLAGSSLRTTIYQRRRAGRLLVRSLDRDQLWGVNPWHRMTPHQSQRSC